jgi:hypothetical protein
MNPINASGAGAVVRVRGVWIILSVALVILFQARVLAEVRLMRVPDGGIQPQVALSEDGSRIHLIYFKGDAFEGDVYYTQLIEGEETWRDPIRINSLEKTVVAAGTVRGAHLALGQDDRVHVAWMSAKPQASDGERPMYYTRMKADGSGFEAQKNVIQHAYGLDGGGTVAADHDGNVHVVWHAGEDGEASRRVYAARSSDGGATFSREVAVSDEDAGACGCCGIRAGAGSNGVGYVLYRTAREEVHRDANLIVFGKEGASYEQFLIDPWELGGCPMTTAALLPSDRGVTAAWETDGQVLFARYSEDGERKAGPFSPPGKGGFRKHPVLARNGQGETIVVWTDGTGWKRGGGLAWQVYDSSDRPTAERGLAEGIPTWGTASVLADPSGAFVLIY